MKCNNFYCYAKQDNICCENCDKRKNCKNVCHNSSRKCGFTTVKSYGQCTLAPIGNKQKDYQVMQ